MQAQAGCIPRGSSASPGSQVQSQDEQGHQQEQEQPEAPSLPMSQYYVVINEKLLRQTEKEVLTAKQRNKVQHKAHQCTARVERAMAKCEYGTAIDECRIGKEDLRQFYEGADISQDQWYTDQLARLETFEQEATRKRRASGPRDSRRPRPTSAQAAPLSQEEQDEQQRKADLLMHELLEEEEQEAHKKTKTRKKKSAKSGGSAPAIDGAVQVEAGEAALAEVAGARLAAAPDGTVAQRMTLQNLQECATQEQDNAQRVHAEGAREASGASGADAAGGVDGDAAASVQIDGGDGEWMQATSGRSASRMQDSYDLRGRGAGKPVQSAAGFGTGARCGGKGGESEATTRAAMHQAPPRQPPRGDERMATMSAGRRTRGGCSQPISSRQPSASDAKARGHGSGTSRGGDACETAQASTSKDSVGHAHGQSQAAGHAGGSWGQPVTLPARAAGGRHSCQVCPAIRNDTSVRIDGKTPLSQQHLGGPDSKRPKEASESASVTCVPAKEAPPLSCEVPWSKLAGVDAASGQQQAGKVTDKDIAKLLQRLDTVGADLEPCVEDIIAAGAALEVLCARRVCVRQAYRLPLRPAALSPRPCLTRFVGMRHRASVRLPVS